MTKDKASSFVHGSPEALIKRKISEETCALFRYEVGQHHGKPVQIAPFYNDKGQLVGQKLRYPDKSFEVIGKVTDNLFGKHLWKDGGKRVVVTEGEIDALSYAEAIQCKWPVVSVPNGAEGALKAIEKNLDWLERFEEVVFAFDNDEPGQKAARKCAVVLSPGKGKIAKLAPTFKDFNEALQADHPEAIREAVWNAVEFRPDGILTTAQLWEKVSDPRPVYTFEYPWPVMNQKTLGIRKGELITLTAGTGIGKTAMCREIVYDLAVRQEAKVGCMFLEESPRKAAKGLMGIHTNTRLQLREDIPPDQLMKPFEEVFGSERIHFYDHFGSLSLDNLMSRVRYFAKGLKCDFIFLDHISIVISGSEVEDERRAIDKAMTDLRTIVENTGCGLFLVSHLKRLHGDEGHENGVDPELSHLRGSQAIAQLSDVVLALSRDQQADVDARNFTKVRCLKDRWTSNTGYLTTLRYDPVTGRLSEPSGFDEADADDEAPF